MDNTRQEMASTKNLFDTEADIPVTYEQYKQIDEMNRNSVTGRLTYAIAQIKMAQEENQNLSGNQSDEVRVYGLRVFAYLREALIALGEKDEMVKEIKELEVQ